MEINWIAILVCGVAAMVIGFVWYSMSVFGKTWMKEARVSADDLKQGQKEMPKTYGLMFLGALIEAYVLSVFLSYAGAFDIMSAATVAFWAWLGFIGVTTMSGVLFEKKSWTWFGINAGYQLVLLVVMSAILITL